MTILAGDIGATSTRLALYEQRAVVSGPTGAGIPQPVVLRRARYNSPQYACLTDIVREFLRSETCVPAAACFGVAGPVRKGHYKATNLSWELSVPQLERDLGLRHVALVNDFDAIGHGLALLGPDDGVVLQDGSLDAQAPVAVIGAGTGLGQGILVPTANGLRPWPSEGGHTEFAPRSETEIDLLRFLMRQFDRVSYERILSGSGLVRLYEFVTETGRAAKTQAVQDRFRTEDPAAVVGELGGVDVDREPACAMAVDLFVSIYGAEAGNLALKVLPFGGLYVAGGIAPKLLSAMQAGGFLAAFRNKGRMSPLVEADRKSVV